MSKKVTYEKEIRIRKSFKVKKIKKNFCEGKKKRVERKKKNNHERSNLERMKE